MPATPQIKFSHSFSGTIWATLGVPKKNVLIIEEREQNSFQVRFSAIDFRNNSFLWKGIMLPERWWVGLTAANESTVLLHTYVNKGNPDHKNLVALDIFTGKIRWKVEEFSFFDWDDSDVMGYITRNELVQAKINIQTGDLAEYEWQGVTQNSEIDCVRPVSYLE